MATSLFRCWERSSWQVTTMFVGICVIRTAEDVLFTCWPPAPLDLKVSILRSSSRMSTSMLSSMSGSENTDAKLVWRLWF